jgi:hypothetical protein
VYVHLLELVNYAPWLLQLPLAFDDACHLYKFITKRRSASTEAEELAQWAEKYLRCDRVGEIYISCLSQNVTRLRRPLSQLHFKNHVKGGWCERNMNPDKCEAFKGVKTEVAEEFFQWFSRCVFVSVFLYSLS